MVIDVKWADVDQDDDLDFIICGDWMLVMILENDGEGVLEYFLEEVNGFVLIGFWMKLAVVDVNQDG